MNSNSEYFPEVGNFYCLAGFSVLIRLHYWFDCNRNGSWFENNCFDAAHRQLLLMFHIGGVETSCQGCVLIVWAFEYNLNPLLKLKICSNLSSFYLFEWLMVDPLTIFVVKKDYKNSGFWLLFTFLAFQIICSFFSFYLKFYVFSLVRFEEDESKLNTNITYWHSFIRM